MSSVRNFSFTFTIVNVKWDLEGLDECPEKDAYRVALPQQLDETSGSKQTQKSEAHKAVLQ